MPNPKAYKKLVLTPGTYKSRSKDGSKVNVTVTAERLKNLASTVKEMNADGLLIPVPYEHDFSAKPNTKTAKAEFQNNAGFWKDAEFNEKTQKFTAIIEAADTDAESIIGKRAKGLSMWINGDYDAPNGKVYKDAPLHLALTNRPMAIHAGKDQEWEELPADSLALCMSDMVEDESEDPMDKSDLISEPMGDLSKLIEMLKKVAKVALPDDVSADSLVPALLSALSQKELSEAEESVDLTKPPEGSEEANIPVVMSEEDQMTKELEEKVRLLEEKNNELTSQLFQERRTKLESRVDSLIMSDEKFDYAKNLKDQVKKADSSSIMILEAKVEALEAVPRKPKTDPSNLLMSDGQDFDSSTLANPLHSTGEITDARADEIANLMLQSIGN